MSGFFSGKSVDEVNLWLRQKKIDSDVIEAFKREYQNYFSIIPVFISASI